MRRRLSLLGLGLALGLAACGGGGGDGDDAVVLREDSFDGVFPGTAWAPIGDLGTDAAAGAPAPSLRIGGLGAVGVAVSNDPFSTAEGLTVRLRVAFGAAGDVHLRRPDHSSFVEVREDGAGADNLRVQAGGLFGGTDVVLDGAFHELEIVVAPGAAAVTVLWDGVVVVDNPAADDPPPTLDILVRGEAGAATRIDEVRVTTP